MEKLVYLLWDNRDGAGRIHDQLRDDLINELPGVLEQQGARHLSISVIDSDVSAGEALHLGAQEPHAMVSFWLECVGERAAAEAALDKLAQKKAGYLVAESQPLKLDTGGVQPGQRLPGFTLVGCIERAAGMTPQDFIDKWETVHRQVAIDTQSTVGYRRNEVLRALTPDAPDWHGLVEEIFPIEALDSPEAFYDAVGNPQLFEKNQKLMVESCLAFINLENVDSHPMSEYRFLD